MQNIKKYSKRNFNFRIKEVKESTNFHTRNFMAPAMGHKLLVEYEVNFNARNMLSM